MKILVLGAGAIGGHFGGLLAHAGADVSFLVRPRRQQILQNLIVLRSPLDVYKVPVNTLLREDIDGPYDLIMLSCKAYDLPDAIETIRPAVGTDTYILPLLNGLKQLDILDEEFGPGKVLGGFAMNISTMLPDGSIESQSGANGNITYGPRFKSQQDICSRIQAQFTSAPFSSTLSDNIIAPMWDKYVRITVLGALNCLLRGTVGDIMATRDGQWVTLSLIKECLNVAEASGHALSDDSITRLARSMTQQGSDYNASMFRDLEEGKMIEGDHLVGDMLRRAEQHQIEAPFLAIAYCHLQAYMARRDRERSPLL